MGRVAAATKGFVELWKSRVQSLENPCLKPEKTFFGGLEIFTYKYLDAVKAATKQEFVCG